MRYIAAWIVTNRHQVAGLTLKFLINQGFSRARKLLPEGCSEFII